MNKKYGVAFLLVGILVLAGAGCDKQKTAPPASTPDTEIVTPPEGGTAGETKKKSVLDVKTYEEGLAMCKAEPAGFSGLCYLLLGAKFDRPDVCEQLSSDPYGKTECEVDAQKGFADAKLMIKLMKEADQE